MNQLSTETSPYLLQHANNPVNWMPWNEAALAKAKAEDKPIIVSIGYSACHWCHVMEHESFENEAIAEIMNQNFICIKVDREERPDVDAIYMDAVQAMGIRGGWPLNVFLMPDTKPFYGGTYFQPPKWAGICQNIADAFVKNRAELQKSAEGFSENLQFSEIEKYNLKNNSDLFNEKDIDLIVNNLSQNFDSFWGGMDKAPKFPMPSIWAFLLQFQVFKKSDTSNKELSNQIENQLKTTLNRMAMGGIYDQIGGGFARYSVDNEWFCPHFEKMLYDNAQLLSLYAKGYAHFENDLYKETIIETINWLQRDLQASTGAFYSAQDADSEGVEGKFYIWSKLEIEQVLTENAKDFCESFQITEAGNWEHGQNILWKNSDFLNSKYKKEIQILLSKRNSRIFPGLDDKILCSWNALLINGLVDSCHAIGDPKIKDLAVNLGKFIVKNFYRNGKLLRTHKNGISKIDGFLEDYATVISAFIKLYHLTFNLNWLSLAETLLETTFSDFFDEKDQFFNFSSNKTPNLIAQKKELFDNVIPASNSIMAHNLLDLGVYLSKNELVRFSETMLSMMKPLIISSPEYLSNWAALAIKQLVPKVEIVIIGPEYLKISDYIKLNFDNHYFIFGAETEVDLPAFKSRQPPLGKTFIYVCINNTCSLPFENLSDINQILKSAFA